MQKTINTLNIKINIIKNIIKKKLSRIKEYNHKK